MRGPQEYLLSRKFNNETSSLLYNLRCRSVRGVKANFRKHFKGDIKCPFQCLNQVDSQEHNLFCKGLVSQLKSKQKTLLESVRCTDIYGTLKEQFRVTSIFLVLMRIRTRLLDKDQQPACEGKNTRPQG